MVNRKITHTCEYVVVILRLLSWAPAPSRCYIVELTMDTAGVYMLSEVGAMYTSDGAIYANDRVRFMQVTGTVAGADGDKRRALFNHITMAD